MSVTKLQTGCVLNPNVTGKRSILSRITGGLKRWMCEEDQISKRLDEIKDEHRRTYPYFRVF